MNTFKFQIYKDARGEWRWKLISTNGRIVADSGEGYSSSSAARDAAQRVKDNAGEATIE
ncbi:YegP family protein [Corallococcus carmarthensis]|uniref:DUF1508 domain-containing protein n=1 Tax=Corallococcus carmarthensis TaxID=2316728 RepID=A0A3A8JZR0_9BACT|nr:DUF1508 domain-containing protein [Corallococcus carmarthensis]RKG97704.1 DUF1508 domain-containing protein [Corallococcus carmarthensis]